MRLVFTPSPGSNLPLGRGMSMQGCRGNWRRKDGARAVGEGERLMGERIDDG